MRKEEFESKTFDEVMEQLNEERYDITTRETLKEFAIDRIENESLFVAIHILQALEEDVSEWYEYDYCMGTLQTPSAIDDLDDIEHMIED